MRATPALLLLGLASCIHAGQVINIRCDVAEHPAPTYSIQTTELTTPTVVCAVTSNGMSMASVTNWTGVLWYGPSGEDYGRAITNTASAAGSLSWHLTQTDTATNGTFDSTMLFYSGTDVQAWMSGQFILDDNPAAGSSQVDWGTANQWVTRPELGLTNTAIREAFAAADTALSNYVDAAVAAYSNAVPSIVSNLAVTVESDPVALAAVQHYVHTNELIRTAGDAFSTSTVLYVSGAAIPDKTLTWYDEGGVDVWSSVAGAMGTDPGDIALYYYSTALGGDDKWYLMVMWANGSSGQYAGYHWELDSAASQPAGTYTPRATDEVAQMAMPAASVVVTANHLILSTNTETVATSNEVVRSFNAFGLDDAQAVSNGVPARINTLVSYTATTNELARGLVWYTTYTGDGSDLVAMYDWNEANGRFEGAVIGNPTQYHSLIYSGGQWGINKYDATMYALGPTTKDPSGVYTIQAGGTGTITLDAEFSPPVTTNSVTYSPSATLSDIAAVSNTLQSAITANSATDQDYADSVGIIEDVGAPCNVWLTPMGVAGAAVYAETVGGDSYRFGLASRGIASSTGVIGFNMKRPADLSCSNLVVEATIAHLGNTPGRNVAYATYLSDARYPRAADIANTTLSLGAETTPLSYSVATTNAGVPLVSDSVPTVLVYLLSSTTTTNYVYASAWRYMWVSP